MSKFLTPPVYYDSNGNLVEILKGEVAVLPGTTFTNSIAIGNGSIVTGSCSIAIGESAHTYNNNTIAIGYNSQSPAQGSIAIGSNTIAYSSNETGKGSIAIGMNSIVYGEGSIAIGSGITIGAQGNYLDYTVQIGFSDKTYTFKVGDKDVFGTITSAAGTFFINGTKYKATYDSSSATLNFVTA